MSTIVRLSPEYFPDPTQGRPVSNGSVYIGVPDLDPEIVANQIQVTAVQENGSSVAISQPIETGAGGVPLYNGSPVTLTVNSSYSMKVLDSSGSQVYYVANNFAQNAEELLFLSEYGCDIASAVSDIGSVLPTTLTVDCDCIIASGTSVTVTSNIYLNVINGGSFDGVAGGGTETLTIEGPMEAGSYKIFGDNLTVLLPWTSGETISAKVAWWGAVADNSTTGTVNSAAFARAIAALPTANATPTLNTDPGRYKVAGDPAVHFNKPMIVKTQDTIFDYEDGTGVCLQFGDDAGSAIAQMEVYPLQVTKTVGTSGTAATDLVGTAMLIQNLKNFVFHKPKPNGFKYGIKFFGDEAGVSYGTVYSPLGGTCLIGIDIDSANTSGLSFATELTFVGGRISFATSTYDTMDKAAGSRLVRVGSTNTFHRQNGIKFLGTNLENAAERKIDVDGDTVAFENCYWDAGSFQGNASKPYYKASITSASSTNGSPIIDKVAHGLDIVDNDKVLITSSGTSSDRGFYSVVSSTDDSITLDRTLYGTETDVALTLYRTNQLFHADSFGCTITGGNNFEQNAVVDNGIQNNLVNGPRGYSRGSLDPTPMDSDYSQNRRAVSQIRESFAGSVRQYFDNVVDSDTAATLSIDFRTADGYLTPRVGSRITTEKVSRDDRNVRHRMLFKNSVGGLYNIDGSTSLNLGLNYDSDGSMAISQTDGTGSYRGILLKWIWGSDTVATDAFKTMPDASAGFVTVSANGECGTWLVEDDGSVTLVVGTSLTKDTNTNGNLCVYQVGTAARIIQRLGVTAKLRAEYNY